MKRLHMVVVVVLLGIVSCSDNRSARTGSVPGRDRSDSEVDAVFNLAEDGGETNDQLYAEATKLRTRYHIAAMGDNFEYGIPNRLDLVRAEELFRLAAENGHLDSMHRLGQMLEEGEVNKDSKQAREWFSKCFVAAFSQAEQGNTGSMYLLSKLYSSGHGTQENEREAFRWMKIVASNGNADAQCDLGLMYHRAWGTDRNNSEAVRWLAKAAKQGSGLAAQSLHTGYGADRELDGFEPSAHKPYLRSQGFGSGKSERYKELLWILVHIHLCEKSNNLRITKGMLRRKYDVILTLEPEQEAMAENEAKQIISLLPST
jgi:TPR repeat protein